MPQINPSAPLKAFSDALAGFVSGMAEATAGLEAGGRHPASALHWRDGLYIAASETIETEEDITLSLPAGATEPAELVGRDPTSGVAVLRCKAAAASLPAAAEPVAVGQLALAVGRCASGPLAGLALVAEAGPAWRSMRGGLIDRRIRLSGGLDPRLEGGAALDAEGRFVGLLLFGPHRRALVIPAETVERVAAVLAEKGHVARGYLGAGLHPVRQKDLAGAMVMSLEDGGPAAAGGIQLGDIVTAWDGETLSGVRDLIRRLGPDSVGKSVRLDLLRGGQPASVDVTVGARPVS
ncbi:MAG: S1C family serine protease [Mesorhizobium sp.]